MEEKIRTMEHEGMLVYHLADCIKLIGKGNPSAVKKKIDTDEIMLLEYQGKGQPVNFITEKGIGIMEQFYSVFAVALTSLRVQLKKANGLSCFMKRKFCLFRKALQKRGCLQLLKKLYKVNYLNEFI